MIKYYLCFLFFLFFMRVAQPISCELTSSQKSASGSLLTVQTTPIAQLSFTYNANAFFAETDILGAGSILYANGTAILQTTGLGSATLSSKIRAYAIPGQGFSCVFAALYKNGDNGTSQIAGVGTDLDGFFFELRDNVFGILYKNNSLVTSIPQSDWNVDKMDGSGSSGIILNYNNGNIYKIQYQQLEFGNVDFFIESSITGEPVLVHRIMYANANTDPSLSNPGLQLMAQVTSSGGITQLDISSMSLFIDGDVNPSYLGIRNSISSNINVAGGTTSNILTIQDSATYSSIANQLMVIPDQLSLFNSSENGEDAIFSLYLNPLVGGAPFFSNVNANSIVTYDIDGTTIFEGTLVGTFFLASGSSLALNINEYGIRLSPEDRLVISCTSINSSINVFASLSWLEQF